MNPQLTTYYMADRIDRQNRDRRAHRRWLAREAAGRENKAGVNSFPRVFAFLAATFFHPYTVSTPATVPVIRDVADCCA
jgi:hypothetical protein